MSGSRPPVTAERILRAILPDPRAEDIVDDFDHAYQKRLRDGRSELRARVWYWGQVLAPDTFRLGYLLRARNRTVRKTPEKGVSGRGMRPQKTLMDPLAQDVRNAFRAIRHSPGFTLVVLLTLTLGIGANTAIFSVVNGIVLRPLPFPDAEHLIRVREVDRNSNNRNMGLSPPNFLDLREETSALVDVAAYRPTSATLTGGSAPERVFAMRVSSGFFELLGAQPAMGRSFISEEDVAGSDPVAIVSHGAWRRRFGEDQAILGKVMVLDGVSRTIVGVLPSGFRFAPGNPEVWLPQEFSERDLALRGRHFLTGLARIRPDVELERAQEEMRAIWARMEDAYPDTNAGWGISAVPLLDSVIGSVRTALLALLGSVVLVLLIACVNVINLTLSRADRSERETAIRSALGASRYRLLRQNLIEHLLLGLSGGALGLAGAYLALDHLLALFRNQLPRTDDVAMDGRVFLFTLVISVGIGVLTTLAVAVHQSRRNGTPRLSGAGTKEGTRVARGPIRGTFVVAEVALSLMLVVGTGLLLSSFLRLLQVDLGFRPENLLTGEVSLPEVRYQTDEERALFFETLTDALERHGGVRSAGAVGMLPLTGSYTHVFTVPGAEEDQAWPAEDRLVTHGYFRTMEIPILTGRALEPTDDATTPPVVVLNEVLARQLFPDESAVGNRVKGFGAPDDESWEVVGVVGNTRQFGIRAEAPPTLYRPHSQIRPPTSMAVVVRASGPPLDLVESVRQSVARLDSELPIYSITTMEDLVSESLTSDRVLLLLLGLFGLIALMLGAVGIFGVMSYTVSQRTREIGVRIAVGGAPVDVLMMVIRQGMTLVGLGIGLGLIGSVAVGRVFEGLLFEVSATDPTTLSAVVGLISLVALAACFLPARRAAAVDPLSSLREE